MSTSEACAVTSLDKGTECSRILTKMGGPKLGDANKRMLSLFFHLSALHRVPFGKWFPRNPFVPIAIVAFNFADALDSLSKARLEIASHYDKEFFEDPKCADRNSAESIQRVDPLNGWINVFETQCDLFPETPNMVGQTWYYTTLKDEQANWNIAALSGNVLGMFHLPDAGAWDLARHTLIEAPHLEDPEFSSLSSLDFILGPLRSCLPSKIWSRASREDFQSADSSAEPDALKIPMIFKFQGAINTFDLSAAKLFMAAGTALDSKEDLPPLESFSVGTGTDACFIQILQGKFSPEKSPCADLETNINVASDRFSDHDIETKVNNRIVKSIWDAFGNRMQNAETSLRDTSEAIAHIKTAPVKGEEAETAKTVSSIEDSLEGAKLFLQRLAGKDAPGELKGKWTGNELGFVENGCGLVPEIR